MQSRPYASAAGHAGRDDPPVRVSEMVSMLFVVRVSETLVVALALLALLALIVSTYFFLPCLNFLTALVYRIQRFFFFARCFNDGRGCAYR